MIEIQEEGNISKNYDVLVISHKIDVQSFFFNIYLKAYYLKKK